MIKFSILKLTISFKISILFIINSMMTVYGQQSKDNFELKGKVQGLDTGMIYLGYYINKEQKVINDSSVISDGNFYFKGNISEPTVAFIKLYRGGTLGVNATNIFLEPSLMHISLKVNKFSETHLTGSVTEKEYEDLRARSSAIKQKYKQQLDQLLNEQFSGNKDSLNLLLTPLYDSLKIHDYAFFLSHPKSYVTAYLLQYHVRDLSPDSLTFFYSRLGYKLQQNIVAKHISEKIAQKKAGSIGSIAKKFVAKDVNGNYLMSQFFKGKYVLLDFWASWCIPCRKNNPHLIELYNKYKEKGLTIIGIADNDSDTSAWKKAIETDSIDIWNHVLRGLNKEAKLKGLSNDKDISDKFGVGVLPTIILINPEGIIVGRYQDELDDLDKMLATVFK